MDDVEFLERWNGNAIVRWHRVQKYRHFIVDECPSPVLDNGSFHYMYRSLSYLSIILEYLNVNLDITMHVRIYSVLVLSYFSLA